MSENSVGKSIWWRGVRIIVLSLWILIGLIVASVLVQIFFATLPSAIQEIISNNTVGQLGLSAVIYLLALLVTLGVPYWFFHAVLKRKKEGRSLKAILGLMSRPSVKHLGLLGLCLLGYLATTVVAGAIAQLIPGFDAEQRQDVGFDNVTSAGGLIVAFIALVVTPPIAEELLFRGYLFGKLRIYQGFWVSAIVTSIIFGLVHFQWNVGVDTFVLSIFLCILREKTGSIWMSMGLHAIKNGVAYFFLFIGPLIGINLI